MTDIERVGEAPGLDGASELEAPPQHRPSDPRSNANGDAAPAGLSGWVESRSGMLSTFQASFNPLVPSVARWRYALGAALVSTLAVQVVTGLLLMCSYSPASSTAWGSTFYIDQVLAGGWFLRGVHNYAAHAMIVVTALHLASVVVAGVYRAPRELNWWLGLLLLLILVAFTLTGNALVWDQDGYWAWNVETSIAGGTPYVGRVIQRLMVGGTDLGNAALGRLYAVHVGLLPILVLALLRAHVALARRHAKVRAAKRPVRFEPAWPSQVFFNSLATAVMLGVVTLIVVLRGGAPLDAPADPTSQYPARPAWFFLWLFDLRKSFTGPREYIATLVIPGALAGVMVLLPFLDRVFPRKFAHFLAVGFSFTVLGVAGYLTLNSLNVDAADPHFNESIQSADAARDRALSLARLGIPPEGAQALLRHDPLFHGKALLEAKCLSCHSFGGQRSKSQNAPDLKDFGSIAWIRGLLENPSSDAYFGKTPGCDGMAEWKRNTKLTPAELEQVALFVASFAAIPADQSPDEWLESPGVAEHPGLEPFVNDCGTCHVVPGLSEGGTRDAPSLFGWGSPEWTSRVIKKPHVLDMYGYLDSENQMPPFSGQFGDNDLRTLYRYLRGDYPGSKTAGLPEANPAAVP